MAQLRQEYDSLYLAIGACLHKSLGIPRRGGRGVLSAIQLLDTTIRSVKPDFTGKDVVIVGGGNVAMDATRTSVRLGAKSVKCVYRRRISIYDCPCPRRSKEPWPRAVRFSPEGPRPHRDQCGRTGHGPGGPAPGHRRGAGRPSGPPEGQPARGVYPLRRGPHGRGPGGWTQGLRPGRRAHQVG